MPYFRREALSAGEARCPVSRRPAAPFIGWQRQRFGGITLMVTRIDRLARSIGDLQDIVRRVKARGASLKATEQPIDTGMAAGECFFDMLGVFSEFETNLRRERQLEG